MPLGGLKIHQHNSAISQTHAAGSYQPFSPLHCSGTPALGLSRLRSPAGTPWLQSSSPNSALTSYGIGAEIAEALAEWFSNSTNHKVSCRI